MKILALIPARGGSKRLLGKNKRLLGTKPLIQWSIEAAKDIPEICDILVSTDDKEIAEIAISEDVLVPWLRPQELASDTATSVDVALHALEWYISEKENVDGLLMLQPTSPFRRQETIRRGIRLFEQSNRQTVIGVSKTHAHPMWCVRIKNQSLLPFINEGGLNTRSQDLPEAYSINGAFYLSTPTNLASNRSFFMENSVPLIMNNQAEYLDIDTHFDWLCAEACLNGISGFD